jgi:hypothetical protein
MENELEMRKEPIFREQKKQKQENPIVSSPQNTRQDKEEQPFIKLPHYKVFVSCHLRHINGQRQTK